VTIKKILCVRGAAPSDMGPFNSGNLYYSVPTTDNANEILPGSSYINKDPIKCYDAEGNRVKSNPNQPFTGVVLVYYNLANDIIGPGIPDRIATMSISTTVNSG
jgi:hypothetical protein